jgi:hypothetical protein
MGLALGRNPFLRGSGGDTTPVLVLTACINDFDPVADSIRCATRGRLDQMRDDL